jgi:hypothetical protein
MKAFPGPVRMICAEVENARRALSLLSAREHEMGRQHRWDHLRQPIS